MSDGYWQGRQVTTECLLRSLMEQRQAFLLDLMKDQRRPILQKTVIDAMATMERHRLNHLIANYPVLDQFNDVEHRQSMRKLLEGFVQRQLNSADQDNALKGVQEETQRASLQMLLNQIEQSKQLPPPKTEQDDY